MRVPVAFDAHAYMRGHVDRKYDALAALAEKAFLKMETEVKPAHLLTAEDLPIFYNVKEQSPVTVFIPSAALADSGYYPQLLTRIDNLERAFGNTLLPTLRPDKNCTVKITPAMMRQVDRNLAALTLEPAVKVLNKADFR